MHKGGFQGNSLGDGAGEQVVGALNDPSVTALHIEGPTLRSLWRGILSWPPQLAASFKSESDPEAVLAPAVNLHCNKRWKLT